MSTPTNLVAYINGVRFYPAAVQYTATAGEFASFSLSFPGTPHWNALQPRSHGVVFFRDPVKRRWRLLCEGDYVGIEEASAASGEMSVTLRFADFFTTWAMTDYFSLFGLTSDRDVSAPVSISVAGTVLSEEDGAGTDSLVSLRQFILDLTTSGTRFSAFIHTFIENLLSQTPVESFYYRARQANQKMFAPEDKAIGTAFSYQIMRQMLEAGFSGGLPSSAKVQDILAMCESLAMYRHTPIPAPPLMQRDEKGLALIPELMFVPHLYYTVPPACNVIFRDQVSQHQKARTFRSEATRVIVQLSSDIVQAAPYFLANRLGLYDVGAILEDKTAQGLARLSHGLLSAEELEKGIVPYHAVTGLEKLQPDDEKVEGKENDLTTYLAMVAQHELEIRRTQNQVTTIMCGFLPYLIPGFAGVVEKASGPVYGLIQSVSHSLSASGDAMTSVGMSHVHSVYRIDGRVRNPFPPRWLNDIYLADKADDTYKRFFGGNARPTSHGALLPADQLTTTAENVTGDTLFYGSRVDIDAVIAKVFPVHRYSADASIYMGSTEGDCLADELRKSTDPHYEMSRYQYRRGTYLSEYLNFHGLAAQNVSSIDLGDPPERLLVALGTAHQLFASPVQLERTTVNGIPAWTSTGISRARQDTAAMIAGVIDRGASRG